MTSPAAVGPLGPPRTFADEARGPWSTPQGIAFDVALTLAAMVVVLAGLVADGRLMSGGRYLFAVVPGSSYLWLGLAQVACLIVRRVRPAWCLALLTVLSLLQLRLTDQPSWGQLAVPIAVYSAAAYATPLVGRFALVIGLLGSVLGPLDWVLGVSFLNGLRFAAAAAVVCGLVVVVAWLLGVLGRTRQAYVEQLIDRGIRLERESAQAADLAATDERARIAREMHDVVAHGLSVMVVQADGARYQLDQDPERAGRALETIAATGRESLAEMRRMLGLLRSGDGTVGGEGLTGTRPQPTLTDLPFLLEQDLGPGVTVTSDLPDDLAGLASHVGPALGLTAYRILQEALTNVRKHAGPGARVTVHVQPVQGAGGARLRIVVGDDGRGAAAADDRAGQGLLGMRERATVHGGTVHAAPRPGGGFEVRAELPYRVGAGVAQ